MRLNPPTTLKMALQNVRCKFLQTNIAFSSNRGRRVWINNHNSSEVPSKKDLIPKVRFHFTTEVNKSYVALNSTLIGNLLEILMS